jgi:DNA ligase-1
MHTIIAKLESDNSRLAKEAIIAEEMNNDNKEFFEGALLCLSPFVTFGVKKVPTHGGPDGQGLPWAVFKDLADKLSKRELTGHDARDAIELCLKTAKQDEWNGWYRRILTKDLKCGVSEKTINNVAKATKKKEFGVPLFTCQLAHDSAAHEKKVCGKKLIEVKLDGVRVLTIVYPDGRVDQYSRNGKELVNFPHIKEQFAKYAGSLKEATVFDGEVMSSSFQDLMKQVHRKSNVQANDAVLHLFDYIPLRHFQKGFWDMPQTYRIAQLNKWKESTGDFAPNIQTLDYEEVDLDSMVGQLRYKEINAQAIAGGYEGIMLKDPEAKYECKRTVSWLKLKPFIEVSLTVVEVEEGTAGTKNENNLGALVCEGTDDGKFIRVNVGSGYSDDLRRELWDNKEQVVGQIVEVRADAATKSQDGEYWSLRFPRFIRFRGFEAGEKI